MPNNRRWKSGRQLGSVSPHIHTRTHLGAGCFVCVCVCVSEMSTSPQHTRRKSWESARMQKCALGRQENGAKQKGKWELLRFLGQATVRPGDQARWRVVGRRAEESAQPQWRIYLYTHIYNICTNTNVAHVYVYSPCAYVCKIIPKYSNFYWFCSKVDVKSNT